MSTDKWVIVEFALINAPMFFSIVISMFPSD